MIMPFQQEYIKFFDALKDELAGAYNLVNANTNNMKNILKDVVDGIKEADFVIADLTIENANVYYELGIAHTLDKKVILITRKIDKLPFDINHYRAIEYSTNYWELPDFFETLKKTLMDDTVQFGNPVSDCLGEKKNSIDKTEMNNEYKPVEVEVIQESFPEPKGIIDMFTEITDDTDEITQSVNMFEEQIKTFTVNFNSKIAQVKNINGSNKNAFLVKKLLAGISTDVNKLADETDFFAKIFDINWARIQENYFSILDNKLMHHESNKVHLESAINTLNGLKDAMKKTYDVFEQLNQTYASIPSISTDLNKSFSKAKKATTDLLGLLSDAQDNIEKIDEKFRVNFM